MAKTKDELLEAAKNAGIVPDDATADDFTADQLRQVAAADRPAWEGSMSATEPIVAPDGHVVLSQEDIDARTKAEADAS
jgi:hypothetical protein